MARFSKKVQRAIDDVVAAARRTARRVGRMQPHDVQFLTSQLIDAVGIALTNPETASIYDEDAKRDCDCHKG